MDKPKVVLLTCWLALVLIILTCNSCSLVKITAKQPQSVTAPDTVTLLKVDTVWTKNVHAIDSLTRVVDSLNEDWARHIDEDFVPVAGTEEEAAYHKQRSSTLGQLVKEQREVIQQLTEQLRQVQPSTVTTIERVVTKKKEDEHTELKVLVAAIVGYILSFIRRKQKQ